MDGDEKKTAPLSEDSEAERFHVVTDPKGEEINGWHIPCGEIIDMETGKCVPPFDKKREGVLFDVLWLLGDCPSWISLVLSMAAFILSMIAIATR